VEQQKGTTVAGGFQPNIEVEFKDVMFPAFYWMRPIDSVKAMVFNADCRYAVMLECDFFLFFNWYRLPGIFTQVVDDDYDQEVPLPDDAVLLTEEELWRLFHMELQVSNVSVCLSTIGRRVGSDGVVEHWLTTTGVPPMQKKVDEDGGPHNIPL
jgi:hypothetical protein